MDETWGESVVISIVQGFIFFALVYLLWGVFDPDSLEVGNVAFLSIMYSFGVLVGRRIAIFARNR